MSETDASRRDRADKARFDYDRSAGTLYITLTDEDAVDRIEAANICVFGYDTAGHLCRVTILDVDMEERHG